MAQKGNISLFDSATRGARIIKQGEIFCLVLDGGGAMIGFMQDLHAAQKWAQSKPSCGNRVTDRGRFLEQIPTLVARPGSFVSTRGSEKLIEKVARGMRAGGYDLSEWMLPPELKNMGRPAAEKFDKKDAAAGDGGAPAAAADPAQDPAADASQDPAA